MSQHVAIIGAGVSGLATANLLARAGYRVTIYEKTSAPGGRAGWLEVDGFSFDTGPSWYLMPEVFDQYYKLLGINVTDELDIMRLDPAYKVFYEHDEPVTIRSNIDDAMTQFDAIEPGAGAKLQQYVKRSREVYDMSLEHFLYTNFTSLRDFVRWPIIRRSPRLLSLAARSMHSEVSRSFRDQRLQQILEYAAVFLGASPYQAPAIYTLMSALDFTDGVYYPRGGMHTLIRSLEQRAQEAGVKIHYNSPIAQITVTDQQAAGLRLDNGQDVIADVVVSAADLHHTETKLLDRQHQTYPDSYWQRRNPGPSAFLLYLGVRGALPELEHHSLFFVDKWRQNFAAIYDEHTIPDDASIYVSRASATDESVAPNGHEALVVLVPFPTGVSLDDKQSTKFAERFIKQLADMSGVNDLPERIVSQTIIGPDDFRDNYNSWQSTALGPAHTLSQSALFRTGNRSRKVKNLYYTGQSTIPGIGLPMCLISAQLVYKHLAGDRHGGPVAAITQLGDRQ